MQGAVHCDNHSIYRQGRTGDISILSVESARQQYDALVQSGLSTSAARDTVQAGGLWCSHGGRMVPVFGTTRVDHFRHLVETNLRAVPGSGGGGGGCGCMSDVHVNAQLLLLGWNFAVSTLTITQFADCRRCTVEVYCSTPDTRAEVEVHEVGESGRRFVSDVVLYDGNALTARIEVYKTHRACTERRDGCPFYEVRADHLVDALSKAGPVVTLKAESDNCTLAPCSICPPKGQSCAPYWTRRLQNDLAVVHRHFGRIGYAHKETVGQWRAVLQEGFTDAQIYGIVNARYRENYLTWRTQVAMERDDVQCVEKLIQYGAYARTLVSSTNPDILDILARHGTAKDLIWATGRDCVPAMQALVRAGVPFKNKRGRSEALEKAKACRAHNAVRFIEQLMLQ